MDEFITRNISEPQRMLINNKQNGICFLISNSYEKEKERERDVTIYYTDDTCLIQGV